MGPADLTNHWKCAVSNRPLPSSKNPHFQNEARCTTFLVKMSFICTRMKNDFLVKGWAPTLVLKQRPGELGNGLFPFNLIGKTTMGQSWRVFKSWYTDEGRKEGFWRCFEDGLNQAPVAQWITQSLSLIVICWIEIYPVEGAM